MSPLENIEDDFTPMNINTFESDVMGIKPINPMSPINPINQNSSPNSDFTPMNTFESDGMGITPIDKSWFDTP